MILWKLTTRWRFVACGCRPSGRTAAPSGGAGTWMPVLSFVIITIIITINSSPLSSIHHNHHQFIIIIIIIINPSLSISIDHQNHHFSQNLITSAPYAGSLGHSGSFGPGLPSSGGIESDLVLIINIVLVILMVIMVIIITNSSWSSPWWSAWLCWAAQVLCAGSYHCPQVPENINHEK